MIAPASRLSAEAFVDLHHLRTFIAVAQEGHLTRASERLFVSQPAISAQLKALEEELGVALFRRVPKGMRLTLAGEQLLDDARRTLAAADGLLHHARGLKGELNGRVRLGLNSDADFLRLADLQAALRQRYPRLELELLPGSTVANLPLLHTERLDGSFVCGQRDDARLRTWTLFEEELAVAVPARLREAVGDGDVPTLARQPWIYTTLDCPYYRVMHSLFETCGCRPDRVVIADQEDALASLVRNGVGLCILRRDRIERMGGDGTMFALPRRLPRVPLSFAVLERRAGEPTLRAVVEGLGRVWSREWTTHKLSPPAPDTERGKDLDSVRR